MASVIRGNSLYTIVDGPSWTQAEANSVKLGGHLVTVNDLEENLWVSSRFIDHSSDRYYLGLNDKNKEGILEWSSGEEVKFERWNSTEEKRSNNETYDVIEYIAQSSINERLETTFEGYYVFRREELSGLHLASTGISETPFIRRGDSAYVIVQGPTWEEAEANAVKLGGHLVTINDKEENDWLVNTYKDTNKGYSSNPVESDIYWTGLTKASGSWKWESGEPGSFKRWGPLEPWEDNGTNDRGNIILQSWSSDQSFWTSTAGNWDNTVKSSLRYGIAEIKLAPNNTPTGTPTISGDLKVGSTLIINASGIQDADNFTGYTPTFKYNWETSTDGTTWSKLTTTDGADNNNTYILTATEANKKVRGVVSYLDGYGTNEVVNSAGSSLITAPVVRGNSLYNIVDGPSWTQAEANSVKLGGHLTTVNTEDEQKWIINAVNPVGPGIWIGYSDSKQEGKWEWSSGEENTYTNWGYPNEGSGSRYEPNGGTGENFAHIWGKNNWHNHEQGTWNDLPNLSTETYYNALSGLSETPFIRRGDSAYVIVQGPTWEEAEANAVKLGGHLVTINDSTEWSWFKSQFSPANGYAYPESYNYYPNGEVQLWVGVNDTDSEGQYKWVSGESSSVVQSDLISFGGGTPAVDDYGVWQWEQGKITFYTKQLPAEWNSSAKNIRGIAEIKLAPNNTPTGTPTVTGTLKVGSTLTIDATAIKDSDNFTGYTPTLKYNWETSTDGTTWSKLTSTDATDNNNTYILTATEANKKIRGVVSYLDGYGTNEVVNSAMSIINTPISLPTQSLTLSAPSKTAIRSGISTTSAITYNVSTGDTALTGVGASLYFDSTQLSVSIAGDPFKTGLLGNAITADTSNADGDSKTDKVLSLSYADFNGNFPGNGTTLPLVLANLNLVPTNTFSGSTLHLKGDPAVGFTATGADLALGYNASPVVNNNLAAFITNRNSAFSYTFRSDLFTDPDSTLSFSATTNTGNTLPSWLSFNPTTRTLSGTPTTAGTINLNLSATDELGSVSTPLTLKVREVQSLSSATTAIRYQRNNELTVPINYSTTDGLSTTGLSFKVHFNSSLLSFNSTTGVTNKAQADLFQIGATQQDTANTDNDATTDSYIPINIASFTGQFPTTGVPVKLADLIFKAVDKPIDPITGFKETFINFTETEAASGYGFSASSASLKPISFSLDLDGDGKITALGDGLMIIRKLFGAAFAGDALTNKAISPTATRTTAEIHDFIQQGIDGGLLDVDKDGKTTALGDGLMVIRHLFGAAFAGDALTNKAISPSSPYFGPPIDHAAVAANIDALKII